MTDSKKLKLNIKGSFIKFWNEYFLPRTMKNMGVELHGIQKHSPSHVEILVEGKKDNLWNVIRWSKKNDLFFNLDEVIFEFVDSVKVA